MRDANERVTVFYVVNNKVVVTEVFSTPELDALVKKLKCRVWARIPSGHCYKCWLDMKRTETGRPLLRYLNLTVKNNSEIPANILLAMTLVE